MRLVTAFLLPYLIKNDTHYLKLTYSLKKNILLSSSIQKFKNQTQFLQCTWIGQRWQHLETTTVFALQLLIPANANRLLATVFIIWHRKDQTSPKVTKTKEFPPASFQTLGSTFIHIPTLMLRFRHYAFNYTWRISVCHLSAFNLIMAC